MVTLKEYLDNAGFDWETGKIIYQPVEGDYPGWDNPIGAKQINFDDSILVHKFYAGYGGPKCPRIIAKDKNAIYFPVQYDGSTWLEKVFININKYKNWKDNPTSYPGG